MSRRTQISSAEESQPENDARSPEVQERGTAWKTGWFGLNSPLAESDLSRPCWITTAVRGYRQ